MNKKSRPQIRYSEEFKRMVVEDIESGVMNVAQACRYYGISTPVSVYKWLELYGLRKNKGQKVLVMSYKEENELVRLRRELALLKKELEEAELRAIAWKSMVDAIDQDLGYPVKKALESSLA
ncbi:MAG TPA: transposase [Candidatus Cloacimonadota bacterium]|nr:transposase [Candidatus Cloacimonadota bacterium]